MPERGGRKCLHGSSADPSAAFSQQPNSSQLYNTHHDTLSMCAVLVNPTFWGPNVLTNMAINTNMEKSFLNLVLMRKTAYESY